MGDVILATSVLSCEFARRNPGNVDWVVAREFAPLLKGHPALGRVWEFDRRQAGGLLAWIRFCLELRTQGYTEILDLHRSLRTRVARLILAFSGASWRRISKQRVRLYGLYLFKHLWPRAWCPTPLAARFAGLARGRGGERPDLSHLAREISPAALESRLTTPYYCVMAGSRWEGKCWPASHYLVVIRARPELGLPVVLGSASDAACIELTRLLGAAGIAHVSGVGRWDLVQTAQVLGGARAYLGNDTGLAHLAEALGVPAYVVFGPTTPEMGFGPGGAESHSLEDKALWCRPCGKDGRRCYRPTRKYLCMTGLEPSQVVHQLETLP